jgi:hypothetical protein
MEDRGYIFSIETYLAGLAGKDDEAMEAVRKKGCILRQLISWKN